VEGRGKAVYGDVITLINKQKEARPGLDLRQLTSGRGGVMRWPYADSKLDVADAHHGVHVHGDTWLNIASFEHDTLPDRCPFNHFPSPSADTCPLHKQTPNPKMSPIRPESKRGSIPSMSSSGSRLTEATVIVVLGASGDLARKKTFPAIFALLQQGFLPKDVRIVGYARTSMSILSSYAQSQL
jgi:hypothetical protein